MAIWQWHLGVDVKAGEPAAIESLMESLDRVLLRQDSWSRDITQWGDLDSTAVEAVFHQGHLEDLLIRIDMRGDWRSQLRAFWELAEQTGCRLITHDGEPLHSLEEAAFAASNSDAARFADDPRGYLGGEG